MKRLFLNLPLAKKVTLITMLVAASAIVIGTTTFVAHDYYQQKEGTIDNAVLIARTAAGYSAGDLAFADYDAALETLTTLAHVPDLINAQLFDANAGRFAQLKQNSEPPISIETGTPLTYLQDDVLHILEPISYKGRHYGALYLTVSTQSLQKELQRGILIGSFGLILLLIFSYVVARRLQTWVSTPILTLAYAAKEIASGRNYTAPTPFTSTDEIGALGRAFTNMLKEIEHREEARDQALASLQKSEEHVRLLLDSTAEAIYGIDQDGKCTFVNPSAVRMLGYHHINDILGNRTHDLIHHSYTDGSTYPRDRCPIFGAYRTGQPAHRDNEVMWRKNGTSFPVEYWAYPIRQGGSTVGVVVTFLDISERKLAEEELEKHRENLEDLVAARTEQLEATNQELKTFSYSVSHDLRAPLRSVDGFSLALLEDYSDALDETGKEYLTRIRKGSQRMGQLIDDLLTLSRVARSDLKHESVNLSKLASDIRDDLSESEPSRPTQFEIDANITTKGDAGLLRTVLENLLGNAWKFTSRTENAKIAFGTFEKEEKIVFFVRDNGAGFDKSQADKLFGAFQRLHSDDEFPGTGIGLATVQRIIHRHGGQVWADSEVGKGATFCFTLAD